MATQAVRATQERHAPVIGVVNAHERPLGAPPQTDAELIAELKALNERLLDERADLEDAIRAMSEQLRLVAERTVANAMQAAANSETLVDVGGPFLWDAMDSFAACVQNLERHGMRIAVRLHRDGDERASGLALAVRVPLEPTVDRGGE